MTAASSIQPRSSSKRLLALIYLTEKLRDSDSRAWEELENARIGVFHEIREEIVVADFR
jgi:hypothetical protein